MMTTWMTWRPAATATTWKRVTTKKRKRKKPVSRAVAAAWEGAVVFRAVEPPLGLSAALAARVPPVNQRSESLLPKSARLRGGVESAKQPKRLPVLATRRPHDVPRALAARRRVLSE